MPLDNIDELRVFAAVARAGSLTAAARTLGTDLRAVSRALARLEDRLGVRLFARTTRRVDITPEGRDLLDPAIAVVERVEALEEQARAGREGVSGRLRLGVPTMAVELGLLTSIETTLAAHPALSIDLVIDDDPRIAVDGSTDVALCVGRPLSGSRTLLPLGTIRPVLAASADYLASAGTPRRPADLARHQCLRFGLGVPESTWLLVDGGGAEVEVPVGGRFTSNDSRTLAEALRRGMGIGLVPAWRLPQVTGLRRVLPRYTLRSFELFATCATRPGRRQRVAIELLRGALARPRAAR